MRNSLGIARWIAIGCLVGAGLVEASPSDKVRHPQHPWQIESRDWVDGRPWGTEFIMANRCLAVIVQSGHWQVRIHDWWLRRGACWLLLGNPEAAIKDVEGVYRSRPEDVRVRELLTRAYNDHAHQLYRKGKRLEQALYYIDRAIELDPGESLWFGTKAEILYGLGRHEEALPLVQRALKDYPGNAGLRKDLANIQAAIAETSYTARRMAKLITNFITATRAAQPGVAHEAKLVSPFTD